MAKYQLLSDHFAAISGGEWQATFSDLEAVMGFRLPKAARSGGAWWADDPARSQSRAWTAHGWTVAAVDHAAGLVVFRKPAAEAAVGEPPPEACARRKRRVRALGATAVLTAGVAVVAGLGAVLARGAKRKA